MRSALVLCLLPLPSFAWTFSPEPICTLSHDTQSTQIVLTYDPTQPLYTLSITLRSELWAPSPDFGMTFDGPAPLTIGTSRHQINGASLTVADSGFGNVLDGLQYNFAALAFTRNQKVVMSLSDAAPEVQKFRNCPENAPATS
jgi:hypothetical protein